MFKGSFRDVRLFEGSKFKASKNDMMIGNTLFGRADTASLRASVHQSCKLQRWAGIRLCTSLTYPVKKTSELERPKSNVNYNGFYCLTRPPLGRSNCSGH